MADTVDVVVTRTGDKRNDTLSQNIRATIELKNGGMHMNDSQAVLQLIVASSLNPKESVLAVITDLNLEWRFFGFGTDPRVVYKYRPNACEAKFLLENMFASPNDDGTVVFPTEFLTRGPWDDIFCHKKENGRLGRKHGGSGKRNRTMEVHDFGGP